MKQWKPDVRPDMPYKDDPDPVCGHGYGDGRGCVDCEKRTFLANFGWSERGVAELPTYAEMMMKSKMLTTPFEELTVAGQRDELLAAVAFLMPMIPEPWPMHRKPKFGPDHPLRQRYGIAQTGLEKSRDEDNEAAAEEATWD